MLTDEGFTHLQVSESTGRFWTMEKHWTVIRVKAVKQETQLLDDEFSHFAFIIKIEYFISMHCTHVRCVRTLQEMLIAPLEKQLVAKSVKV